MISLVIPAFNEEKNLEILLKQIREHFDGEIIVVDDGSTDSTGQKAKGVKLVSLRSRKGKAYALKKGFEAAKGDIIVTMDADLQDDPTDIKKVASKIGEYDVVSGWRKNRSDRPLKRMFSWIYNSMVRTLTGIHIHDFNSGMKAYTKEAAGSLKLYGEMHRYIPVLLHWKGYKVGEVEVTNRKRMNGKSKYGTGRILKGFFDLVTLSFLNTFRTRPLHFFGSLGAVLMLNGFVLGGYLSYLRFFAGQDIGNRPLLLLSVLLIIVGIQLVSMGLLGELIISREEDW